MTWLMGRAELFAELIGLGWALGMALYSALFFALYLGGVPCPAAVLPALAVALVTVTTGLIALRAARQKESRVGGGGRSVAIVVAGLGLAVFQMGVTVWTAQRSPFQHSDAWLVWGFKARMFALSGPPSSYFHHLAWPMHPDYPLNLPIMEALFLRLPDPLGLRLAALVSPACLGALVLLFYAGLARLYGRAMAALAAGALSAVPVVPEWAGRGYADVPVAMYTGAAVLYLVLWWQLRRPVDLLLVGLLAGGAVWTKKEGLPVAALLLLACAIGEAARRDVMPARRATRILSVIASASVLPLPWLIFTRTVHPLGGDFLPITPAVFAAHVDRLPTSLFLFGQETLSIGHWSVLWTLLIVMVVVGAPHLSGYGHALLAILAAQLGLYVIGYVFSDWASYTWHIHTSLDRLMTQAVPLAVLVVVELAAEAATQTRRIAKQTCRLW